MGMSNEQCLESSLIYDTRRTSCHMYSAMRMMMIPILVILLNESQEFLPSFGIFPKDTQHGARQRFGVDLLHAPHHHTHVPATEIQIRSSSGTGPSPEDGILTWLQLRRPPRWAAPPQSAPRRSASSVAPEPADVC